MDGNLVGAFQMRRTSVATPKSFTIPVHKKTKIDLQ